MALVMEAPRKRRSTRGRTPFERHVLPGFAAWLVKQLEADPPDYLVPVETRAAQLLAAAMDEAWWDLGYRPRNASVVYQTAFPFIGRDVLSRSRVTLFDEAVMTGATLNRQARVAQETGCYAVRLLSCFACDQDGAVAQQVDAYMRLPLAVYREQMWRLTQLTSSRGLPPEVDHHVFVMELGGRLEQTWNELIPMFRAASRHFEPHPLSPDGAVTGCTLHWPEFTSFPTRPGLHRDDGVEKIRVFADFDRQVVYVLPMCFPRLRVGLRDTGERLSLPEAVDLAKRLVGPDSPALQLLRRADPSGPVERALYRTVLLDADVTAVKGLVDRIRADVEPRCRVRTDPRMLDRLYSPAVGDALAHHVDERLAADDAVRRSPKPSAHVADDAERQGPLARFLIDGGSRPADEQVVAMARRFARFLLESYATRDQARVGFDREPFGCSFAELAEAVGDDGAPDGRDRVLASRALDFALSSGHVLPYTDFSTTEQGGIPVLEVARRYRTVEPNHLSGEGEVRDLLVYEKEVAQEAIASIVYFLRRRSTRWRDTPIPPWLLESITAVLTPRFASLGIPVGVRLGAGGPEPIIAQRRYEYVEEAALVSVEAANFRRLPEDKDAYEESPSFVRAYRERKLRLWEDGSLRDIEAYVDAVIRMVESPSLLDARSVLDVWALTASGRLGCDYVVAALGRALVEVDQVLARLRRDEAIDAELANDAVEQGLRHVRQANDFVRRLRADVRDVVRSALEEESFAVELELLDSLRIPRHDNALYGIASALCSVTEEYVGLVGSLVHPGRATISPLDDEDHGEAHVLERLDQLDAVLRFGAFDPTTPPRTTLERFDIMLTRLVAMFGTLATFGAAVSWRHAPLPRLRHAGERERESVILFGDLNASTVRSLAWPSSKFRRWKDAALGLAAQWGRAFGGIEVDEQRGDDIALEFPSVQAGMLCGAVIEAHLSALRSTRALEFDYALSLALDVGPLWSGMEGKPEGPAINRAATLAKLLKDRMRGVPDSPAFHVTPDALARCPREWQVRYVVPATPGQDMGEINLASGKGSEWENAPGTRVTPRIVKSTALCDDYVERMSRGSGASP